MCIYWEDLSYTMWPRSHDYNLALFLSILASDRLESNFFVSNSILFWYALMCTSKPATSKGCIDGNIAAMSKEDARENQQFLYYTLTRYLVQLT